MTVSAQSPAGAATAGTAARCPTPGNGRPMPGIGWDPLTSGRVRAVVVNTSKDPDPKATMLLFWPGSSFPWAAAKLPSTPRARSAVRREAGFLLEVHDRFGGEVLRTIPRRLTAFEAGLPDGAMLAEALDGVPISINYCRPGHLRSQAAVARDFDCVARWLADLHAATTQRRAPRTFAGEVADRVSARFAGDATRAQGLLAAAARGLDGPFGPRTVVHGDFWMGNVLVAGGRVSGVVDWESADITGEPLRDVARFALSYALYLDRGTRPGRQVRGHAFKASQWGAGVRYLLTGTGWFPTLARDFLTDAMTRLGADPASWRKLLVVGLAEVAAGSDNDEWASRHLALLDRLTVPD